MTATPPAGAAAGVGPVSTRGWIAFTTILTVAVFLQAVTAGRTLDGDGWALDVHRTTAGLLVLATVAGGLVALLRLRDRPGGRRFGSTLVAMGVGLVVQYGLGTAAADGKGTLWIHIPLGVAFVGFTMRLNMLARRWNP
jgi:hypothetical protein